MMDFETQLLAWMRRFDEKLDGLCAQMDTTFAQIEDRLGQIEANLLVLKGTLLRLERREVETTDLKALYDRHERRLEDHERRLAKLEGEKEP